MTNEIMKLADSYMRFCAFLQDGKGVAAASKAREALEQALQAQAAEIGRLKASLNKVHESMDEMLRAHLEIENTLCAKLDAATKVPLSATVLNSLWGNAVAVGDPTAGNLHIRYARDVEAAHNIKGTTP